tara:strand:- start:15058 stop:15591 length:534 start_codon:yes stop_codon:yes gene_type:complete
MADKPTLKMARQVVEEFYLNTTPKPIPWNATQVEAVVFYAMKEGHPIAAIRTALPKMRAFTINALGYHLKLLEEAAHQPSEQRNKHPKMFVPEAPVERTEKELEVAQQKFGEMRKILRGGERSTTPPVRTIPPEFPKGVGAKLMQSFIAPVTEDSEQTYPSPLPPPTPTDAQEETPQ